MKSVEPGVTKVYDRYSYDKEKQEALNAWGALLSGIVGVKGAAIERGESIQDVPNGEPDAAVSTV